MSSAQQPSGKADSPFAIPLDDLVAGVHVPQEEQVTEVDTDVPPLPSEAERRRAAEMRVITHGG